MTHALSNLAALVCLSLIFGTLVGAWLTEPRSVARCTRCRREFDSAPACSLHVLSGDCP